MNIKETLGAYTVNR